MKSSLNLYITDFGDVLLPDDFPMDAFRKNGLPDRRRKVAIKLQEYVESLTEASRQEWEAGKPVHGLRAIGWADWLKKVAA